MKRTKQWFKVSSSMSLLVSLLLVGVMLVMGAGKNALAMPSAIVTAHKSADVTEIPPEGIVEYTIAVTNTYTDAVTFVITDTLIPQLSYVPGTSHVTPDLGYFYTAGASNLVFQFYPASSLAVGQVLTLTFQAKVYGTVMIGDRITNTATVHAGSDIFSTNEVVLTVSPPPTARIDDPLDGELITSPAGTVRAISGVVWNTYDPAPFPAPPVLDAISNFGGGGDYAVEWKAGDAYSTNFILQESKNSLEDFETIATGAYTTTFLTGRTRGVYYYRVRAYNTAGRPSGWSNVVSATVTTKSHQAYNTLADGANVVAHFNAAPVVSLSINQGPWQAAVVTLADDYWNWSFNWTLPQVEATPYTIQARAADEAGNIGPTHTITVTIDNGIYTIYLPLVLRRWPPVPYAPVLNAIDNPSNNNAYTVSWSYGSHPGAPVTYYTLQEATAADFSNAVTYDNIAATQRAFTDKADSTYYYRVRGNNSWGPGEWSNVVSTQVNVRPYPPVMNAISNPNNSAAYTVTWSYDSHPNAPVAYYTLQEATAADFSNAVTYDAVLTTYRAFTGKANSTYYYRVRGNNAWGSGDWSNVVSTYVDARPSYSYLFNTTSTEGWGIKRSDEGQSQQLPAPISMGGDLYHMVVGSADFSILSPMAKAPSLPYTIIARADIVDNSVINNITYSAKNEMTYGFIFGGNDGSPCPATRYYPNGCLSHYYRILVTYDQSAGALRWQLKRIDYHEGDSGGGAGRSNIPDLVTWSNLNAAPLGWNEWKIELLNTTTNNIKIYVNNTLVATITDTAYVKDPYFGTFLATPKTAGGIAVKWDRIEVLPK
ncbi:MAG TPA: hypothetical protein PKH77_01970 [Anaerolineae bacterium]|nr:hypothetical protein [Anaerolineae bacterium]